MQLPRRGDPTSRLVIALVLFCDMVFWFAVIWLPLLIVVQTIETLQQEGISAKHAWIVALALVGGSVVSAVLATYVARGLGSGHRLAYVLATLFLMAFAVMHTVLAIWKPQDMPVSRMSHALVFLPLALIVGIVAVRDGAHHG